MADVIVLGYPDEQTARKVVSVMERLAKRGTVDLADAAIVACDCRGKASVLTTSHATRKSAAAGAVSGLVFGSLLSVPLGGLAVGGLVGATLGKVSDTRVAGEFVDECGGRMRPGTFAVVAIVRNPMSKNAVDSITPYGGEVLRTSLSDEAEQALSRALVPV